ncbi:MAG TPA: hypothetical protein VIH27_00755 [Nitrososphaerales archaeon]
MSLEKINQYISELEAVKFYDTVKKERDDLSLEIKSLHEVKVIVGEETLTLAQLIEKVAQIKAGEIKTDSETLFKNFKSKWETNEKTNLVHQESIAVLTKIMVNLRNPHRLESKETKDLSVKVEEILNTRVDEKIKAEFKDKVDKESDRKSDDKINSLMNETWPQWFELNRQPKINQLMTLINSNVLTALLGPWNILCPKCKAMYYNVMLIPEEFERLITTKRLFLNCEDQFGNITHEFTVSLSELLKNRLNLQSQPPIDGLP